MKYIDAMQIGIYSPSYQQIRKLNWVGTCEPGECYMCSWRMYILLFWDGRSYRFPLTPTCLMCHLRPLLSYWASVWISCPLLLSRVLKSLAIIVLVLIYPIVSVNMLYIFRYFCIRCLCVNESHILFLFWSLYHHIMTFLVFCYNFCYTVYFRWVSLPSLSYHFYFLKISFSNTQALVFRFDR